MQKNQLMTGLHRETLFHASTPLQEKKNRHKKENIKWIQSQVLVTQAFNLSTQEVEASGSLSSRPACSTKRLSGQPRLHRESCLRGENRCKSRLEDEINDIPSFYGLYTVPKPSDGSQLQCDIFSQLTKLCLPSSAALLVHGAHTSQCYHDAKTEPNCLFYLCSQAMSAKTRKWALHSKRYMKTGLESGLGKWRSF